MQVQFEKTEQGVVIQMPAELIANSVFDNGNTVNIWRENGHFVISHPDEPYYDIEDMIGTITDENRDAEISTGRPVGNEVW